MGKHDNNLTTPPFKWIKKYKQIIYFFIIHMFGIIHIILYCHECHRSITSKQWIRIQNPVFGSLSKLQGKIILGPAMFKHHC